MSEGQGEAVKTYVETGEFPEGLDLAKLLRTGKIIGIKAGIIIALQLYMI